MTKSKILTAINESVPFVIKIGGCKRYHVAGCWRFTPGNTTVIVVSGDDTSHPVTANDDRDSLPQGKDIECVF